MKRSGTMRKKSSFYLFILLLPVLVFSQQNPDFNQYFQDKTMRVDFYHVGDAESETITLDEIYDQGQWAGNTTNLIDRFNNGRYYVKIYDVASNTLIYSKGFDDIFGEYKTTTEAINGVKRTYSESALIPYPKNKIRFVIEVRNRQNLLHPIFDQVIDPESVDIIHEPLSSGVKVYKLVHNGNPHLKVDIAILAEGYTAKQQKKAKQDFDRFAKIFFEKEPYKSMKEQFNIYGVFSASQESGTDEPTHGKFRNTTLNSSFNSLGSPRYLLIEDNKRMRDVAAHAPYDALYVMVNSDRYGGGGIYNLYCTFTTDNQWYKYLFHHEFGHSFTGLGDEYYTSSTAYNDFYPRGVEPTEPNITALLDTNNLKWKDLVEPGTPIPTPWGKAEYDSISSHYQKIRQELNQKIAKMEKSGAPAAEIKKLKEKSEQLSKEDADKMDAFLANVKYAGKVGAFEGSGYSSKGLYRPEVDCIMFSKGDKPFDKVCQQAIRRVIEFYSE